MSRQQFSDHTFDLTMDSMMIERGRPTIDGGRILRVKDGPYGRMEGPSIIDVPYDGPPIIKHEPYSKATSRKKKQFANKGRSQSKKNCNRVG